MLTFLVIEAAGCDHHFRVVAQARMGDRQILARAAGALLAYALHAFVSGPAFDSASIVVM